MKNEKKSPADPRQHDGRRHENRLGDSAKATMTAHDGSFTMTEALALVSGHAGNAVMYRHGVMVYPHDGSNIFWRYRGRKNQRVPLGSKTMPVPSGTVKKLGRLSLSLAKIWINDHGTEQGTKAR